jgi:membrane-associated protease RseP (regulator of RpoE activity)
MKHPWFVRLEIAACAVLISGCASAPKDKTVAQEKPVHQRGWIGGSYKRAKAAHTVSDMLFGDGGAIYAFPPALTPTQKAGVLITALATNTPAYQAGLRAGDLILELDHQQVLDLPGFWQVVTETRPGATLPVKAYRDGQTMDYTVTAGREKFQEVGTFAVGLPGFIESFHPIPTREAPYVSLVALGYEKEEDRRVEFGSVREQYRHACNPKEKQEGQDGDWAFWLAIFRVSQGKKIVAQEEFAEKRAYAEANVFSYSPTQVQK